MMSEITGGHAKRGDILKISGAHLKDHNGLWIVKMVDSPTTLTIEKLTWWARVEIALEKVQEFFCWHTWMGVNWGWAKHGYDWSGEYYCIHCGKWLDLTPKWREHER